MTVDNNSDKYNVHGKITRMGSGTLNIGMVKVSLKEYTVQEEIGHGGMAVVYKAIEKTLNRPVALKVLSEELSRDKDLIRRFINEAQAAAKLSHPNIVQIYSIGQESGIYYFAMEYIRGRSVESILDSERTISLLRALEIIKQTALALEEAYRNDIVHRDIKPGNLLINNQGIVKVADFGLAAAVKGVMPAVGGKIIGTPLYISPERAQGKEGDFRSDIYSLGITFYQIISGNPPFVSNETGILLKNHIETPMPLIPVKVPATVRKLILRMTDKDPGKRFPDYYSLIKEIERLQKTLGSRRYFRFLLILSLLAAIAVTGYNIYYRSGERGIEAPTQKEVDRRIQAIFDDVGKHARDNPEAYRDVIKEYFNIMKEYPHTEWAFRAEQKVDQIIRARASLGTEELQSLKLVRDKLTNEHRYGEAIAEYQEIKEKYKDTSTETYAKENIDYIKEEARKDFKGREEQARIYLNEYKFDDARRLYNEVIDKFGFSETVTAARDKLRAIGEMQKNHQMEEDARAVMGSIRGKVEQYLDQNQYEAAGNLLKTVPGAGENPILQEALDQQLAVVEKKQIEYESNVLKEKMESQYNSYSSIKTESRRFMDEYKYQPALDLVTEGIDEIKILDWKGKLQDLQDRLRFLIMFQDNTIAGINEELKKENITDITASRDKLIYIVSGGCVGVPWAEVSPKELYQLAKNYLEDDAGGHMLRGVFCLTYGMPEIAREEFAQVLRQNPQMDNIVEKYLIQLTETDDR